MSLFDDDAVAGPIPLADSLAMYAYVDIDRDVLHDVLRMLAPKHLKPALRKEWSPANPTRNFCYVVSEWLHTFRMRDISTAYSLVIPGDAAKHYFVRSLSGALVDLTAEQFADYRVVDYSAAKKAHFMYPSPSKRARELQDAYEALLAQRR